MWKSLVYPISQGCGAAKLFAGACVLAGSECVQHFCSCARAVSSGTGTSVRPTETLASGSRLLGVAYRCPSLCLHCSLRPSSSLDWKRERATEGLGAVEGAELQHWRAEGAEAGVSSGKRGSSSTRRAWVSPFPTHLDHPHNLTCSTLGAS